MIPLQTNTQLCLSYLGSTFSSPYFSPALHYYSQPSKSSASVYQFDVNAPKQPDSYSSVVRLLLLYQWVVHRYLSMVWIRTNCLERIHPVPVWKKRFEFTRMEWKIFDEVTFRNYDIRKASCYHQKSPIRNNRWFHHRFQSDEEREYRPNLSPWRQTKQQRWSPPSEEHENQEIWLTLQLARQSWLM
jgi:hypothetical protein